MKKLFNKIRNWRIHRFYRERYVAFITLEPNTLYSEYMYLMIDNLSHCKTNLKEFYKLFR